MSRGNNIDAKFCAHGRLFSARPTTPSPMGFDDPKSNYSDWKRARRRRRWQWHGSASNPSEYNVWSLIFFFFLSIYDNNNNGREFVPTDVFAKWVWGLDRRFSTRAGPRSSAAFFRFRWANFFFTRRVLFAANEYNVNVNGSRTIQVGNPSEAQPIDDTSYTPHTTIVLNVYTRTTRDLRRFRVKISGRFTIVTGQDKEDAAVA